eukprot:CAMPEP_0170979538 /NCGR_PEP_ID=MMETSP0736-20130129/1872_1 /TAXON_ID=186038 /ORGANISM="Fragilariopsis kerguelensis, Strain L26-C5" /LENGTH=59 /DNA_ID=CAMNT_0011402153 /DNA_START=202 /DNA_END=381 /DNA_ORIENTATION=+
MEPSAKEIVDAMHQAVEEVSALRSKFNAVVELAFKNNGSVTNGKIDISKSKKGTDGCMP